MRKLFTSLFLLLVAVTVSAQQLPNYGFNSWKTSCGNTDATGEMRQRPGVEPSDWSGSSVNQKVSIFTKKQELIFNEGGAVKMQSVWVGAGSIGSVAPGYITLGTPWVYASMTLSDCDGGTYGGVSFSNKPDAITGRFKRTDSNDENSYIVAYLWNGTFKSNIGKKSSPNQSRDNVDRAILGMTSPASSGTLVAKCNYAFKSTGGDWQTITVPIEYLNNGTPSMMNVVISGGDYWSRGNLKENTTLLADDIKFLYYSELASLRYDGIECYGSNGIYNINDSYDPSRISMTSNGKGATIEKSYDSSSNVLTVTVKGNDFASNSSNYHEYLVNFVGGEEGPVVGPDENEQEMLGEKLMSLADADPDKAYMLYNEHFTAYAIFNAAKPRYVWTAGMRGDATHSLADASYSTKVDLNSPYSCWTVKKTGDRYSLCNVGTGVYLDVPAFDAANNAVYSCVFSEEEVLMAAQDLGDGKFAFTVTGGEYDYLCAAPQSGVSPLSTWQSSDAGAAWQLIENPNVSPNDVEPTPVPIDYLPAFTGAKTNIEKYVGSLSVNNQRFELTYDQRNQAYLDVAGEKTFVVAGGKEVSFQATGDNHGWMHAYVYIDTDKNGFEAAIAEDGYTPTGDLVSYSFYNNGAESDDEGWNSVGDKYVGDARSTLDLPNFVAPDVPGAYRMRFKFDWCNIDPNGDQDGKFGDFMEHGGQIIDMTLLVRSVVLDNTTVTLVEGATLALNASVMPADEETESIEWSTSDAAVATVDESGLVTAISAGTATITAKAGELTATCEVTVERAFVAVEEITLDQATATLVEGETMTLVATVTPDEATEKSVTWTTSDENVATVDEAGVVTAVSAGVATITAKAGDVEATCEVTVERAFVAVEEMTLGQATATLVEGETMTLVATVTPDDATEKSVTWTSSDDAVATVDEEGVVTAISAGVAIITAKAGDVEATCEVTVESAFVAVEEIVLDQATATLVEGETMTLVATVTPDEATEKSVTWTTSDENVATVDEAGVVTAVSAGVATITAKAGDVEATCEVTVESAFVAVEEITLDQTAATLVEGETITLVATVTPDEATDKAVTWTTSDDAVATVDEEGVVTAISAGVATITAKAGDVEATCEVTVESAEPEVEELVLVAYAPSDTVGYLSYIDLQFNHEVEFGPKIASLQLRKGLKEVADIVGVDIDLVDETKVTIYLGEEITASGSYVLYIPEGAFYAKGTDASIATTVKLIVKGSVSTGIDAAGENEDVVIYDLAGRKILKTERAGIYIINGKKVIVK